MTIRDGFKLGLGLALAQFVIALTLLVVSIPVLYVIGSQVKDAAQQLLINGVTK